LATLSTANPTILDLAKASGPDGKVQTDVIEILNQQNEILDDMGWQQGNLPTGHLTTIRSGLPTPTWRKLYGGVIPNKGTTVQVTDTCGMLEAYAEIDKALADINGNAPAFRLLEDRAHIEGMNQELTSALFFANEATAPEKFTGFAPRFNLTSALNGENIIKAGGSGTDNTSIWLVVWGPNTVHGIVPKNSVAGIQMQDLGEMTIQNPPDGTGSSGGKYQAYVTHYRWDCGLTVRDWRYVVRICNIDKSDLSNTLATGANLTDLMTQAIELIPNLAMGRPVFYVSRTVRSMLRRQIVNAVKSSTLSLEDVAGRRVVTFDGIPVRRVDTLAADEALVV
jgi:hypothetical protein